MDVNREQSELVGSASLAIIAGFKGRVVLKDYNAPLSEIAPADVRILREFVPRESKNQYPLEICLTQRLTGKVEARPMI